MSIFFVFGMTRAAAEQLAAKNLPSVRLQPGETEAEKMDRFKAELENEARIVWEGPKVVRLSEGFATPEFAATWMALARKGGARDLRIRCRKISVNASGQPMVTDKGNPKVEWIEWEGK